MAIVEMIFAGLVGSAVFAQCTFCALVRVDTAECFILFKSFDVVSDRAR